MLDKLKLSRMMAMNAKPIYHAVCNYQWQKGQDIILNTSPTLKLFNTAY